MASGPTKFKRSHNSNNTSMNNHKKSNYQEESNDASSSSSDYEIFKSLSFRKQHNVNKHRRKSYALRRARYKRIIVNDSRSDEFSVIDSVASSSPKKRNQQPAAPNFKPSINKVIEGFKQIFVKFTLQLNKLQLEDLKNEIITEENAENIIFIISCIISKMKEELTNHEQKLNNEYFQQSMTNNCKITVLNSLSRRSSNTEYLQPHTKSSSESDSTYTNIISTRRSKTSLTLSENLRHNSDFLKSKDTTLSRLDTRNDIGESSKENSTFPIKVHNNNSSSSNLKDVQIVLHKLSDINVIKKSAKNPTIETKVTEGNVLNLEVLKSKLNEIKKNFPVIEKDLYTNNFSEEKEDYSSDVDSTCSTVALGYSKKRSMHEDDKFKDLTNTDIHRYNSRSKSPSVGLSTSLVQLDDTIQFYNSDSDESLIMVVPDKSVPQIPKNKDVDHSQIKKATSPFSEISTLIAKYPSISIVRSNSPRKSTSNENKIDRMLTMDCRVLVEKLVLPNAGKPSNK
ncbi:uncharacterized protein LOC128889988 isoform X2 [Hylaeus anthracinus]|uniref:uncharacterized protein LOC128889988 isoform X2 n=1 Tax=Hylaeus anthracinus TaxID=313031 RepID=UPI0023B9D454|nr:uncharacterized protein LOC128889988 isoform X2 [Hylaeus anthracinus]